MSSMNRDPSAPAVRTIKAIIAHDHPEVANRLRRVVASQGDMVVIGEIRSGETLIDRTLETRPDVVLLDLAMSGCGLRALQRLAEIQPPVGVVVLAMDESNIGLLRSVLAHGALGYVVAVGRDAELVSVIRKITAGHAYVDVPTGGLAFDPRVGLPPALRASLESLSPREREVLEAVAYGYTNREIAEWLGVGVKSVETYRYRLAEKLGFKSRADLVRFALAVGLLDAGGDPLAR